LKTWYPSARAATSRGDPGSVTTTMRSVGSMPALRKYSSYTRFWLSVSRVDPDLDEMITAVSLRRSLSAAATCPGSVESRTVRATP
jgi:hypothetical protein